MRGGQYALRSPVGRLFRIVPCGGKGALERQYDLARRRAELEALSAVVLNRDGDDRADAPSGGAAHALDQLVRRHDPAALCLADGTFRVGNLRVLPVIWRCGDPPGRPGVPAQQVLERLVAGAVAEAWPGRGESVARWLADPPQPELAGPKHHALSYLAKWYAEHGYDDFFRALWRDDAVAGALSRRLRDNGCWDPVEALVREA